MSFPVARRRWRCAHRPHWPARRHPRDRRSRRRPGCPLSSMTVPLPSTKRAMFPATPVAGGVPDDGVARDARYLRDSARRRRQTAPDRLQSTTPARRHSCSYGPHASVAIAMATPVANWIINCDLPAPLSCSQRSAVSAAGRGGGGRFTQEQRGAVADPRARRIDKDGQMARHRGAGAFDLSGPTGTAARTDEQPQLKVLTVCIIRTSTERFASFPRPGAPTRRPNTRWPPSACRSGTLSSAHVPPGPMVARRPTRCQSSTTRP